MNKEEQEKVDEALFSMLRALRKWEAGEFEDEDACFMIEQNLPVLREAKLIKRLKTA